MAIQDFLTNVASKVASNFMSAANQRNNTNTANNNNAMFKAANNAKQKKTGTSSTTTLNPNRSYSEQTLNQMSNTINQPFRYDPDTDAAAQSAIKAAQRQMRDDQVNTNAMLRASGQGKSSYSEGVANQIAGRTAENIATNIIPFYQQQAYQQYQDRIGNLGNLYSYQNQEYFQNPIQEAQVTGNYLPGPARQAIQSILNLKQQAETPGITPQQLQGLSQQAQTYRDQLDSMGIDSSQFGADVTRQQSLANYARAGVPTLEAARLNEDTRRYEQDFAEDVRRYDQDFNESIRQFGVDTALRQAGLEQDAQQFAANQGLQWAQLSQRDKEFVADQVWRQRNYDLALQEANAQQEPEPGSLSANQFLDSITRQYTDSPVGPGGFATGEQTLTMDPARREQMFWQVIDAGYDNGTTDQLLRALGLTTQEIERFANGGQ